MNVKEVNDIVLHEHLMIHGIDKTYKVWTYHGESKGKYASSSKRKYRSSNQLESQVDFTNIMKTSSIGDGNERSSHVNDFPSVVNYELRDHPDMCDKLREDVGLPLWPGCTKFSKLSAVLTLFNLKASHQVSDVFFTEMLEVVSDLLPDGNVLPRRAYDAT